MHSEEVRDLEQHPHHGSNLLTQIEAAARGIEGLAHRLGDRMVQTVLGEGHLQESKQVLRDSTHLPT